MVAAELDKKRNSEKEWMNKRMWEGKERKGRKERVWMNERREGGGKRECKNEEERGKQENQRMGTNV